MSTIALRGKTRTYRLSLATNALCEAEAATGLRFADMLKTFRKKRPDPAIVRRFLEAALVDCPMPDARTYTRVLRDLGGVRLLRAAVKGLG